MFQVYINVHILIIGFNTIPIANQCGFSAHINLPAVIPAVLYKVWRSVYIFEIIMSTIVSQVWNNPTGLTILQGIQ
jgi:hypothetical protein